MCHFETAFFCRCYQQISDPINSTQLQSDLDSLLNWSILNSLPFNLSKFVHMSFKSKIITSYHIAETTITHCSTHHDLGILFSDNLSWDLHYQKILAKAYKSLGLICRTFKSHGCIHSRKLLYISLVQSKLLFCSPVWNPYLLKHIQTLERLQRRATKYILNDYHTDYKTHLIRLNVLPITYTLDIANIMFLIKSLKNPTDNFNILDYVSFSNNQTRSSNCKLKYTFTINYQPASQSRIFYYNTENP